MCGIYLSIGSQSYIAPSSKTRQLLNNRGPDAAHTRQIKVSRPESDHETSWGFYATFYSTVLALRGPEITSQPLEDADTGSVLCWNGEAWKIGQNKVAGNDTQAIFNLFLQACSRVPKSRDSPYEGISQAVSSISGPYAFVFYDGTQSRLYYGRDCLGRRSLVRKSDTPDELILSSVCDTSTGEVWSEVDADGLYLVDLDVHASQCLQPTRIPQIRKGALNQGNTTIALPFPSMNKTLPDQSSPGLSHESHFIGHLHDALRQSLEQRVSGVREAIGPVCNTPVSNPEVAVLFSGGLDCTLLARICHDLLPTDQSIDLLNVAFENPRIHASLDQATSPYELCPDRVTGRSSLIELQNVCPERIWRFVEINIPYTKTLASRQDVITLMHPHDTEMDLSIAYALYFASQGVGVIRTASGSEASYKTSAHVLLSGLGADELFGGYQRHATAFSRSGFPGLIDELELDFDRLGKRNLGRDDRVISDSGKEVRFPYLDEDFIAWALSCPVWAKCGFGDNIKSHLQGSPNALEPGKRLLRLLAWKLRMDGVAVEKKRAIQFGSRTAKMVSGRSKGTQSIN